MKRSFTLIELLITISIIVLMAVVAVPYFNSYSVKVDLNAKTEEIKYFIETAYAEAQSPQRGSNGSVIKIETDKEGEKFKKINVRFNEDCFVDAYSSSCTYDELHNSSISLDNYSMIISNGNKPLGNPEIRFLSSNTSQHNVVFCKLDFGGGLICDQNLNKINFSFTKYSTKSIIIIREPFAVDVE